MGTFRATFTTFSTSGLTHTGGLYPSNGVFSTAVPVAPEAGSGSVVYTLSGNCISLDGSPAVSFAGLPSGFNLTSFIEVNNPGAPAGVGNCGTVFIQHTGNTAVVAFIYGLFNGSTSPGAANFTYNMGPLFLSNPAPSALSLIAALTFNLSFSTLASNGIASALVYETQVVDGTYQIVSGSWHINGDSPAAVKIGDTIKITATGTDLTKVTEVDLTYIDPTTGLPVTIVVPDTDFTIWFSYEFDFLVPVAFMSFDSDDPDVFNPGHTLGPVTVTIISTEFSGSVVIGALTVYYADASGIYQLIPNKRNDTIYKSKAGNTTEDVAILNPFASTGLIGG